MGTITAAPAARVGAVDLLPQLGHVRNPKGHAYPFRHIECPLDKKENPLTSHYNNQAIKTNTLTPDIVFLMGFLPRVGLGLRLPDSDACKPTGMAP